MRTAALMALIALVPLVACQPPPVTALPEEIHPSSLRPPSDFGPDVMLRQRVTASWQGREESFDAVLQKQGGRLVLLGLSELGVGFSLVFEHGQITLDNRTGRELPFPPSFILMDVQRVFFPWCGDERTAAFRRCKAADGTFEIAESWKGDDLSSRSFHWADEPSRVVIQYDPAWPGSRVPRRAVLVSERFGYTLTIETLEVQLLD